MPVKRANAGEVSPIPHLDGVVSQARHDFLVVILKAINALGILRSAVYPLKIMLATPPIVFDGFNVFYDIRIQLAIEGMSLE